MKAEYDKDADALQIHIVEPIRLGYAEDVNGDGTFCFVEVNDADEKVGVELLDAKEHLYLLSDAAEQYDLDAEALTAAARAAIAAPYRQVTIDVASEVPA